MTNPLILICDDDPERARKWSQTVERMPNVSGAYRVEVLSGRALADAIDKMSLRRALARSSDAQTNDYSGGTRFDEAALALIDYDLTPSPDTPEASDDKVSARLRNRSGEAVAYLARCYSLVGFLVVMNQRFQTPTFDVTLQHFSTSYADLNICADDIENSALWTGRSDPPGNFHPWSWPVLTEAASLWESRYEATELEAPVLSTLDMQLGDGFVDEQLDLLGEPCLDGQKTIEEVTFGDLVTSSLGLQAKDRQPDLTQCRRIAASVVARWLENSILPGQNVLTDLPHAVAQFPHLLGSEATTASAWDVASSKSLSDTGLPAGLRTITQPRAVPFLTRSVWKMSDLRATATVAAAPMVTDYAFCEDTSRFVAFADAQEVETNVAGPYSRRFVERVPNVRYHPQRRIL